MNFWVLFSLSFIVDFQYEMGYICKLQVWYMQMQEKIFIKWINNVFQCGQVGIKIWNLYIELVDGIYFLWLLEFILGEVLLFFSWGCLCVYFLENSS